MDPLDRRNRVRWGLIGALLLAVGTAGLLAGLGAFGDDAKTSPVLPVWLVERWDRYFPWGLVAAGLLGLALAWYGWRLLRRELRPAGGRAAAGGWEYLPGGPMRPDSFRGRTMVRAGAVARGTKAALEGVHGVQRAMVGLFGDPGQPELRAQIDVDAAADIERVRREVAATIERLAATTGFPPRGADLTLRLVESRRRRVS